MGALLELVPDREKFLKKFNQAGIPGVRIEAQKSVKCGITGTHMEVLINGEEEESLDLSSEEGNAHSGHSHVTADTATYIFTAMIIMITIHIKNTHIIICTRKKPWMERSLSMSTSTDITAIFPWKILPGSLMDFM